ncbi:hypothetical protein [Candidatus Entotheonella palauensis]|uniref:hypothetical protein n=1 Tax=Candidatus Entotheonella palauensis TaxID=93172 RepID=UPI000B7FB347|nr:hypothetical protein [Candidatus Entotheonella palauensis]
MPLRGPFFLWNPTEKSTDELEQTFVPVDGVLRRIERDLREQSDLGQVTHFLIIGQRGTGKTTHLALLYERFRADLNSPYCPIFLREEHPGIYGLRGLYERILEQLAQDYGLTAASRALHALRCETEEILALAVAESAMRQLWRDARKRVLLLFDHFNEFVESQLLPDTGDWRLRSLLQLNPPMVLVAASPIALHEMMEPFSDSNYIGRSDELHRRAEQYENAFFQFFLPLYLRPLDGAGVRDLIETRARWDGEEGFWQRHQARIQAITTLTGGNPRLVMALYRLLAEGDIASAADDLRQLLDLLSEYFRDRWKDLPKQEQRVIHALIEIGVETAPGAIAKQARLSPNVTSKLLERLTHSGLIAYRQKGARSRVYALNDRLFSMWYQMRFIKPLGQRLMGLAEALRGSIR